MSGPASEPAPSRGPSRVRLALLLGLSAYAYMLMGFDGVQRPYVRESFGLDDAGIATLMGLVQLGTVGAFLLLWQADRLGRRWLLLWILGLTPLLAVGTSLAPGVVTFALLQIGATAATRSAFGIVPVVLTEEAAEGDRPRLQGWFGGIGILGAMAGLLLMSVVLDGDWRIAWALAALPLLALPFARRTFHETDRFERARTGGRAGSVQLWHVFQGPYRRRAAGLFVASTLRGAAVIGTLSWGYYHAIENLGLDEPVAAGLNLGATLLGLVGVPLGARLADAWGRRPTVILGATLALAAGVAFYWVPADLGAGLLPVLGVVMVMSRIGTNAFSVGDRLVDTEVFPTRLRATYTAWGRLGDAIAGAGSHLVIGRLADPAVLGGIVPAISIVCVVSFLPSVVIYLCAASTSRRPRSRSARCPHRPRTTARRRPRDGATERWTDGPAGRSLPLRLGAAQAAGRSSEASTSARLPMPSSVMSRSSSRRRMSSARAAPAAPPAASP